MRYRAKADVRPLLAEKLSALNEGRTDARGTLTLALFVNDYYEPYARSWQSSPLVFSLHDDTVKEGIALFFGMARRIGKRNDQQPLPSPLATDTNTNFRWLTVHYSLCCRL